jgi:AraC-like DNA-binding protein
MKMPVRFRLSDTVCDAYKIEGGGSSDLHGHHHFLLTLIVRGEGVQLLNGREVPFAPHDLFILSPADFHCNRLAPGTSYDYFGVKFPYELLDSRLSSLASLDRFPLRVRLSEAAATRAEATFAALVEECNHRGRVAGDILRRALVEELFILALREIPALAAEGGNVFINRALGYLYSHFAEPVSVADAAAYVGYTPNYFNTLFREAFGVPFAEHLRSVRLSYAKNLLTSGTVGVTEAAAEAGFVSLPHFSRSFRERYGLSPAAFKKLQKKADF